MFSRLRHLGSFGTGQSPANRLPKAQVLTLTGICTAKAADFVPIAAIGIRVTTTDSKPSIPIAPNVLDRRRR